MSDDQSNTPDDELCPCGSGKVYEDCCKKEYDQIMETRAKLKAALADPGKAKELANLIKKAKQ
jgi:uncharacterized protein YchJ